MLREAGIYRFLKRCYKENLGAFLGFEVIYAACLLAGLYPMVRVAVYWVMRVTGFGYLTAENVGRFFRNPVALLLLLAVMLLWVLLPLGGILGIAVFAGLSAQQERCSIEEAVRCACRGTLRIFQKRNRILFLLMIPFALLSHLANVIRFAGNFLPASFWRGLWRKQPWLIALIALAVLVLIWLFVRWRYVFPIWSMGQADALQAARESWQMTRSTALISVLKLLGIQCQLFLIYAGSFILLTILILLGGRLLSLPGEQVTSAVVVVQKICFSVYDTLIAPVVFSHVCRRYFERTAHSQVLRSSKTAPGHVSWSLILLLVSVGILTFNLYGSARGRFRLRVEGIEAMQVTAHRGASMQRPENTMAAFAEAVEQGADWIELDVHESADGKIFVMHDSNFARTTGVESNVWELTWDEIAQLDAGSSFSPEYAGEPIPLLSQVLEFALEEGIYLNIELKPTGHEKALVESVVRLIQEYGVEETCVVTSQAYAAVQRVRELSDRIHTAYVSGLAYGAVNRMTAADAFSVQSVSISRSLVRSLHNKGIEVYAWTVDSRKNINRMIDYGVDNIITNNVPLARKCINESQAIGLARELLHSLDSLFA